MQGHLYKLLDIHFGLVRMHMIHYRIFWIISKSDLVIRLKFYRQIVGILMGTNCAPLVADFFLFCYERDFITSFSNNNQAHIIEAFNSTSLYLDDLLDINDPNFEGIVNLFFPPELKFNKANTSDTKTIFLDLHLSISNGLRCQKSINDCDRHPPTSKYNFTSLYINKD